MRYKQHKRLDTITLFHRPSLPSSIRVLNILKQASAQASETATEDQASDHSHQNKLQRTAFKLDVTENPPTSDQLRTILEYVGGTRAKEVVDGARNEIDAMRSLGQDPSRFKAPVVSVYIPGRNSMGNGIDSDHRQSIGTMAGLVSRNKKHSRRLAWSR